MKFFTSMAVLKIASFLFISNAYSETTSNKGISPDVVPTIVMGEPISQQNFKTLIGTNLGQPVKNNVDFCVGIIDDDEKAMHVTGIQYRVLANKFAIEQLIFKGKTQNFNVLYAKQRLSQNTTPNDIKKLNVERSLDHEAGEIVDGFNHQHYPYANTYILREKHRDDLVYAYFNREKLVALRYVVQC